MNSLDFLKPFISAKFLIPFIKACLNPNSWVPPSGVGTVLQKDSIKVGSSDVNHLIAHWTNSLLILTLSSNVELIKRGVEIVFNWM